MIWYLHSSQVTEQWTSCTGQETPDILLWRAQMLSNVINQLQPSPQLCYSKNAWNPFCFTSPNPGFYIFNKAEQLFNVLLKFFCLWLYLNLRFFYKMDFCRNTIKNWSEVAIFSLILLTSHVFHCTQTELIHWHVIKICWRNLNML